MNKLNKNFIAVALVSVFTFSPVVMSMPFNNQDVMTNYYKENEKYSCSPEELADFIHERRKSLVVAPNLMTGDQFIENKVAISSSEGEDNCLTLFDNLKVIEDIKKLYSLLQKIKMPSISTDGMGLAAQALAEALFQAAMESVCNALTKEAAKALIDEIMDRQLGFDINDIEEFDPKAFAKDVATDHAKDFLDSKGVDPDWLDQDNHKDMISDEISKQKESLIEEAFDSN